MNLAQYFEKHMLNAQPLKDPQTSGSYTISLLVSEQEKKLLLKGNLIISDFVDSEITKRALPILRSIKHDEKYVAYLIPSTKVPELMKKIVEQFELYIGQAKADDVVINTLISSNKTMSSEQIKERAKKIKFSYNDIVDSLSRHEFLIIDNSSIEFVLSKKSDTEVDISLTPSRIKSDKEISNNERIKKIVKEVEENKTDNVIKNEEFWNKY